MNERPSHISRYEILDSLGGGWSGMVYRAVDPLLDREVVVKLMTTETLVDGRAALDQFLDEAKAAARLQHRNIVTTFDYGEEQGVGFLVREYLRGQSLASRMRTAPPEVAEALDIVADVCSGLEFAHDRGVAHRDIKPSKIWLTNDGTVKLMDFGFVRSGASTLANYREFAGTVGYMAPELIAGGPTDGRADVFSIGAVLYELLSGRSAFGGDSAVEIMQRVRTADPMPFEAAGVRLPDGLSAIVMRALAKDPAERYDSAADLGLELQAIRLAIQPTAETVTLESPTLVGLLSTADDIADRTLQKHTVQGPAGPVTARPARPLPRSALVATAAIIVLVFVVGAVVVAMLRPEATKTTEPPTEPKTRQFKLSVQSESGATVFVDGADTGQVTPATLDLSVDHPNVIRLTKTGFEPAEHVLTPAEIEGGTIRLELRRRAMEVAVRVVATAPSRSRYRFEVRDGSGKTSLSALASDHEVLVRPNQGMRLVNDDYFLDWTVPKELLLGGAVSPPALGLLQVVVPDGASWGACAVWLDGRRFGSVLEQKPVVSGRHAIQLRCDESAKVVPAADVVDVEPGEQGHAKEGGVAMRSGRHHWVVAAFVLVGAAVAVPTAQSVAEDPARVRYESGRRLLGMANYKEALVDLDECVRAYPKSPWAGEALVLKAEYFLEVERNLTQAKQDLDRIKEYPNVAPLAYLLNGRVSLASSRARASIDSAALDFSRAEDFYRTSAYVPESRYRAGEALQLNRQLDEAVARYQELALAYPASIWTARALVRLAVCLTGQGRWQEAFSALQRVRTDFRGRTDAAPELDTALSLSSILYRVYIRRPPAQVPFRYSTAPNFVGVRFEEAAALAVSANDTLAVAERNGIVLADRSGERLPVVAAREPRAVAYRRGHESLAVPFRDNSGPVFATEKSLQVGTALPILLKIPDPSNVNKTVERVSALAHTWKREWLVADPGSKSVWVFSDAGDFVRPFLAAGANLSVDRIAINAYDEVAMLDSDRKVVAIYSREGEPLRRIEQTGPHHKFDRPVDISFDAFGHLYVLDRGKSEVVVFGARPAAQPEVETTFVSPAQRDPAAFRRAVALAVDSRGRLHVYDDGLRKVQVYQ